MNTRAGAVNSVRPRLLAESFPLIRMFIPVSLTGPAGFVASVAILFAEILVCRRMHPRPACWARS